MPGLSSRLAYAMLLKHRPPSSLSGYVSPAAPGSGRYGGSDSEPPLATVSVSGSKTIANLMRKEKSDVFAERES